MYVSPWPFTALSRFHGHRRLSSPLLPRPQVYHLNIEEAARELGIGMTKLKEHCRTLGIPRWPSRKLKSMDKLIESLNERAALEPGTKDVSHHLMSASHLDVCGNSHVAFR